MISPAIVIDEQLEITEDLVIILPVCLSRSVIICYTFLDVFSQTGPKQQ